MSADCSFFNDWIVGSGVSSVGLSVADGDVVTSEQNSHPRWMRKSDPDSLYDVHVQSVHQIQTMDHSNGTISDRSTKIDTSALNLLAMTYGNSSDSEEDHVERNVPSYEDEETSMPNYSSEIKCQQDFQGGASLSLPKLDCGKAPLQTIDCYVEPEFGRDNINDRNPHISDCSVKFETDKLDSSKPNGLNSPFGDPMAVSCPSNFSPVVHGAENVEFGRATVPIKNASFASRSDEDSSRMHVFCLEHAVEVEQQLHSIGGVHILLLCHPDYPNIVAQAKLVAEELGINAVWNDVLFRNATKEDEEKVQLALDSEEAIPGNGDWAVKLGINLFYSVNLSYSPLYSKQMPYNSVIYKAFGHSCPTSSPTKSDYGRRPSRQRKVVAGKWCGKVWMSNQVHSFLKQTHPEEQEQERSFRARATPEGNFERKPETNHQIQSTLVTRKFSTKRKMPAESMPIKKVKCVDTEDAGSEDLEEGDTRMQRRRIFRSKPAKFMERLDANSYDSADDNCHKQKKSASRRKQVKCIEREERVSNYLLQYRRIPKSKQANFIGSEDAVLDDLPNDSTLKQCRKIPRSKVAKYAERDDEVSGNSRGGSSHKQHKRIPRSREARCINREDLISDDSLELNSRLLKYKRIPKRKQTKWIEREDAASDDSVDNTSHRLQPKRIPKDKQAKRSEREDEVSDDSLEDNPRQLQHKRIPKSKQANRIERVDAVSNDSLEDNSYHLQHKRVLKRKQAKCIERKDAVSEDSLKDKSRQFHRRIPKSKQAEWFEGEGAVSDDSLEDNSHQLSQRVLKSKQTKWIEGEYAVSDNSLEGNTRMQHQRISRDKPAKCIEMEDAVSYDSPEDNSPHLRRISRSKKAKCSERVDAASCDSLEDNSYKKHGRILRSKQLKTETLQKMKQETTWHMKSGKRSLTKHETLQQLKQLTRQRSGKRVQKLDSFAEEGGPSTRLRKRIPKPVKTVVAKSKEKRQTTKKKVKNASAVKALAGLTNAKIKDEEGGYQCDLEGCTMSFGSKQELALHKRNICPVKGCGKKFFSHKYLVQHRRVHLDDRPLKCPWKGCKMTFKWAWARTEHIRVHTGARPYVCAEPGCGQTFRFVSDFSRHKRKTGHSTKKGRG